MRQFYTWVFEFNVNDANSRYSPGNSIFLKYPHLEGVVKLEEFAVPEEKIREYSPGKKWGYRLGYFEADDSTLSAFGTSVSDIVAKAKLVYAVNEITTITDEEAVSWIRKWGEVEEVSPGKLLVTEAGKGIMGEEVPAKYLIIE